MTNEGIRSVGINAIQIMGARTLTILLRGVYVILLARYLGPEIYGLLIYGQSWYLAFLPLTVFGLAQIISREIGRNKKRGANVVRAALAFRIISTFFGAAVCAVLGLFVASSPLLKNILLLYTVALAGRAFALWAEQVFIAHESSQYVLQQEAIFRSLEVLVGVLVIFFDGGVLLIVFVHAFMWWLQAARGFFLVRNQFDLVRPRWDKCKLFKLATKGLPICLYLLFLGWLNHGPLVLFRFFIKDETSLGQLALTMQMFGLCALVPLAIGTSALPVLSRSALRKDKKDSQFMSFMVRAAFYFGGLIGLLGMSLSPYMVVTIFGSNYELAGELFKVAIWIMIPFSIGTIISQVLIAQGKFATVGLCSFVGAFILTAIFPFLVSEFESFGAMFSSGIGMSFWALSLIFILLREKNIRINIRSTIVSPFILVLLTFGIYVSFNHFWGSFSVFISLLFFFMGFYFFDGHNFITEGTSYFFSITSKKLG